LLWQIKAWLVFSPHQRSLLGISASGRKRTFDFADFGLIE
jgi:hypothetical protein